MKFRNLLFTLVVYFFSLSSFAQLKPVLYGGVDYFRNQEFGGNAYVNVNTGVQIFKLYFLAPEIGFEHHIGSLEDRSTLHPMDPNARAPAIMSARFSSSTFSIAPKLIFGNDEAAFVFLPQYNTGTITARGDLLKDTGRQYVLYEQQKYSEFITFWSFAAGVEGQFFNSEVLHFSLTLKYSLLNSEDIFNKIDFRQEEFGSAGGSSDGMGIGFRVYFDFIQLIKNQDTGRF